MIERKLIYDGTQEQFFQDVRLNKLADKMKENFEDISERKVQEPEYSSCAF